jgi:hypothetical protein
MNALTIRLMVGFLPLSLAIVVTDFATGAARCQFALVSRDTTPTSLGEPGEPSAPMTVCAIAQISIHDRPRYAKYVAGFVPILGK